MSIIMMYVVPNVTSLLVHPGYAWERHAAHPTEREGSKDSGDKGSRSNARRGKLCVSFFNEKNSMHTQRGNAKRIMKCVAREKYCNSFLCHLSLSFSPSSIRLRLHRVTVRTYRLRLLTGCYVRCSTPPIAQLHRSAHILYMQRSIHSLE